jgi:hypothetical protein
VGLLRVHAEPESGAPDLTRNDWAFNAGAGVIVVLNEAFGVRGDLRYFRYFESHDDLPQADTSAFDFWRTSIGITWSWPVR